MNTEKTNKAVQPALVVGFWIAISLVLRLFGITQESLWWDEYTSHVYLDAPSLLEFLWLNRTLDPLTLPFYYTLEYLWNHYVTDSVLGLRLLSIAIGAVTLPLVYSLGKHLYGRQAGYVAIALLALSPVHIHHSQSIRMYVVFVFLATAVVVTFTRLLGRPGWSTWFFHGLASFLMYWTHPFAGLVPAALGGFLLLRYRRRKGLFWRWTLLQVFLYAPTLIYLSTVRFWPQDSTSRWIEKPGIGALLADLFFDDINAFHWQLRLSDFAQRIAAVRMVFDLLFTVLIALLLLWTALRLVRRRKDVEEVPHHEQTLLLVVWLVLPPLMLFVLSHILRPCMFPRYTVHCIVPLYLLLGGTAASIRKTAWRSTVIPLLVSSMFLQWAWLQPGPQRTDWRSAGALLHEETSEGDVVLVENFLWRDVFTHNLKHLTRGPLPLPVAAAKTPDLLAAQAALCTGVLPGQSPPNQTPRVWAVLALDYFDPGWPARFEQCLRDWGIAFERTAFPSIRRITVYKLTSPPSVPVPSMKALFTHWTTLSRPAGPWTGDLNHSTLQAFGDLATEFALHGRTQLAQEIFDTLFSFEHAAARDIYGNLYAALEGKSELLSNAAAVRRVWDGYGYRENGQAAYACWAFKEATALDPQYATAYLELGYESYTLRRHADAAEAFARAAAADGRYHMLDHFIEVLRCGGPVEEAFEAVQAYRAGISAQSRGEYDTAAALLREAIEADPQLVDAHTSLAFVLILQRKLEEARAVLATYFAQDESPVAGAYGLLAVIHIARDELDQALACVDKAAAADQAYEQQFGPFFNALLREKHYERTIAAMDALKIQGVDLYPLLHEYVVRLLH